MALPNIGSISDQTLGGLISTASHGSGVTFPVLSKHVKSLTLALPLPGAPIVRASPTEDPDLFQASLCGLGATGLLLEIEVEVEPAFRLRETKQAKTIDYVLDNLDSIKKSAEHVRLWWYADGDGVVVGRADRTYEVSPSNVQCSSYSRPDPLHQFGLTSLGSTSPNSFYFVHEYFPHWPHSSVVGHGGWPKMIPKWSTTVTRF